jgi:hypothetical protein
MRALPNTVAPTKKPETLLRLHWLIRCPDKVYQLTRAPGRRLLSAHENKPDVEKCGPGAALGWSARAGDDSLRRVLDGVSFQW